MIDRASFPPPAHRAHCEFGGQPGTDVPFLGPHVLWFDAPSCSSHLRGGEGHDLENPHRHWAVHSKNA